MLHDAAVERLARSPGLGERELAALQRSCVAVVGVGALGGWVCWHLAMLGVAAVLIDDDSVAPANLANQAFPACEVGEPKAAVRARQMKAFHPNGAVRALTSRIEELGLAALAGVDLIISALDSRGARIRVAEIGTRLGIPVVDAAVDGSGRWLLGTVTAYDSRRASSPCYLCSYSASSLADALAEERPEACPSWRELGRSISGPTLQASAFGSVIAGFQAQWAVKILTGQGSELAGLRLVVSASQAAPRTRLARIARNPRCVADHRLFEPLHATGDATLGATVARAEELLAAPPDELTLHGRSLAIGLLCPACRSTRDLVRVTTRFSTSDTRCRPCGHEEMVPVRIASTLDRRQQERLSAWTWAELGLPVADVVTARAGDAIAHFVVNTDTGRSSGA